MSEYVDILVGEGSGGCRPASKVGRIEPDLDKVIGQLIDLVT